MKKINLSLLILVLAAALIAPALASSAGSGLSADDSLRLLKEGNARYLEGKPRHPHQDRERRALTTGQGQHPLAAVLTCSDSRVPVEIIFDQGIGDIFVVRVAGNVAATDEVGSVEYAVDHLDTPLVVVLGHTRCDAVSAVVDDAKLPPNIAALVEPIKPAVAKAREANPEAAAGALLAAAIKANVWQAIEDIFHKSKNIAGKVKAGKARVLGALYELDTGQVQWLGPHPNQDKLVGAAKAAPADKKKKGKPADKGKKGA